MSFPHGLFDFALEGCTNGRTVTFTITYPSALPAGAQYWKYGPTQGNATPHWYTLTVADNALSIVGNTVSFSITDGELGDDDWQLGANGTIIDQGGPGSANANGGGAQSIPALTEWGVLGLSLLLGLLGLGAARRRYGV